MTLDFVIVDDGGHEDAESFSVVVSNPRPASPAPLAQALVASPPVIQQADLVAGVSGAVTIVETIRLCSGSHGRAPT